KHTMRMVRLHKAKEIVQAKIAQLTATVEQKRINFQRELDNKVRISSSNPDDIAARNAVYLRLASQKEAGIHNFYNEYRSWYWNESAWAEPFQGVALDWLASGAKPQFSPTQMLEAGIGFAGAGAIPGADRNAIGRFLGAGGSIAEYSGFKGVYFAYLMSAYAHDVSLLKMQLTTAIMVPLMATAVATIVYADALRAAWSASPFTWPLVPSALAIRVGGMAQYQYAQQQLIMSQTEYAMMQLTMFLMMGLSFMSAGSNSITDVMRQQVIYEDAKAELDYFTKVPDMRTLKERMIQYGAQHGDNDSAEALYKLTDEDLIYLFDRDENGDAQYIDQNGNAQTLTAEEESESLDLTSESNVATYKDAFGRYYDPTTIINYAPGPLDGGTYAGYTRIKSIHHNGQPYYQYARIVSDENQAQKDVYNMGEILRVSVDHGAILQQDRRQKYMNEGNAIATAQQDAVFVYTERDSVFSDLFEQAAGHAEGGREYTGYRMTFEDYVQNQKAIFDEELVQKQNTQLKEWELREQELQDRYDAWETRMNAIIERGVKSWAGVENAYTTKWREWEREYEDKLADAEEEWQRQQQEHFTKKQEWEDNIRAQAAEASIRETLASAVDELNSQILMAGSNFNEKFQTINKTAFINQAIEEMKQNQPTVTEKIKKINDNIKKFDTQISISELTGSNTLAGADAIAQQYREQMREHAHNMKVQANVKAFEEYRRLIRDFKYQIEVQNEAMENQTRAAALQEGFIETGDVFVKQGNLSSQIYVANAYTWYDVEEAVDRHLTNFGFTPKSNDEMFKFLEDADNVEVESYFYTQKLAVQAAFEKIIGSGTDEERKVSKEEAVIGEFGRWAGRRPGASRDAGDAFDQDELRRYAQHYEPEMLMNNPELLN
ncbi:MAG: hypothetical protein KDK34_06090, partial [Leptospiraceae bacterium]|nr:hypothetical protein [Leptospiraceae bacterium]